MRQRQFYRAVALVPDWSADLPVSCFYEIDHDADAVLRSVEVFADGRVLRDSVDLEQRNRDSCPSLVDHSLAVAFADAPLEEITADAFGAMWAQGQDYPFWFPFSPAER